MFRNACSHFSTGLAHLKHIKNVALNQMLEATVASFGCSLLTGTPSYNNCSLKILINVYFYQVAK